MNELAKKISEYQIFNFLLPGTLLAAAVSKTTSINLIIHNVVIALFCYYFLGLVISRVGSLVVEPILKGLKIVKFEPYHDYVEVSKSDLKLEILAQESNTYRTLIAALIIYVIIYLIDNGLFGLKDHVSEQFTVVITVVALIGLFVFAYRKQTAYVSKRIRREKSK
jgi:quinol-cytochrome oxidoreductase complex cytochrome b subunit